jgi:phage terminase small subunit
MGDSPALTPKQQRFVDEYLIDLNATQAAIRAGYSVKTAGSIGSENLSKPEIAAAIQVAVQARAARVGVTADSVLAELARIGFSDMKKFATWGPGGVSLVESDGLDADSARCVAEVSQTISAEGGSIKFKLHDKPAALVHIGKHIGMFADRHEHTGRDGKPIEVRVRIAREGRRVTAS